VAIYLIRHPEPAGVRGMCYGRRDFSCDAHTLASAASAARAQLPERALADSRVFTSPLSRCRALARALIGRRAVSVAHELIELDFGAWEGIRWDALPRGELDAWARDVWHYRPGGGESAAMVEERWRRWCDRIASLEARPIVAVTHAGVIRTALAASGVLARPDAASANIAFGSVYAIEPPARSLRARRAREESAGA
jgi:alpha-ribazole phosphatase